MIPHVHGSVPVSSRQRTVSATAPLPLTGAPNNASASTVAPHERERRKREVSSSYGTTTTAFCERAVKSCKFAYCHSASRKCKNVVFAGVLSPISFAVERNGAVGDKNKYLAPGRETLQETPPKHQKRADTRPLFSIRFNSHPSRDSSPPEAPCSGMREISVRYSRRKKTSVTSRDATSAMG